VDKILLALPNSTPLPVVQAKQILVEGAVVPLFADPVHALVETEGEGITPAIDTVGPPGAEPPMKFVHEGESAVPVGPFTGSATGNASCVDNEAIVSVGVIEISAPTFVGLGSHLAIVNHVGAAAIQAAVVKDRTGDVGVATTPKVPVTRALLWKR
jgi:hypothetical protein